MHRLRSLFSVILLSFTLLIAGVTVYVQHGGVNNAYAGAQIVGDPSQANARALIAVNGSDKVTRIVYFKMANHVTGGANTPVASSSYCGVAGDLHDAIFKLSGTMAGTTPTLAILWQNSKDDKSSWSNVGTWTTINATVTPASQEQTVADLRASTAVAYGDCWRVIYTMTGANAAANFSVTGIDK